MKIYLVKKTNIKIQNKYIFRTIISKFLYFFKKTHGSGMVAKPRRLGHARPRRGSGKVLRLRHLGLAFFFNNTSEVHKKLLVQYPETIQHICMSTQNTWV
jgi:hypothetical protein